MSTPQAPTIYLQPPPIPHDGLQNFTDSNRSISSALSPTGAELAVWVSPRDQALAHVRVRNNSKPEQDIGANSPLVQIGGKRPYGQFVDEVPRKKTQGVFEQDKAIYFAQYKVVEPSLNKLYTDSHVIFSSLQTLYKSHVRLTIAADVTRSTTTPLGLKSRMDPSRQATSATPTHAEFSFLSQPSMTLTESKFGGSVQDGLRPGRQQIVYYRKIMDEYVARLEDVIKDVRLDNHIRARQHAVLRTLQLASTLYVPVDGQGLSVVGEELLDWYNGYYDPEGTGAVSNLVHGVMLMKREWEHEDFEEAIVRTILRGFRQMTVILLATLKAHPQPSVVAFAQILVNAANTLPRSNNTTTYPTELAFVAAHARWRDGFKAQVTAFTRGRERSGGWLEFENEDDVEDDSMEQLSAEDLTEQAQNFENFFMGITNLLLGDADKVLLESQDWIAAMAIWGVLVEPTLKRDDLPVVLEVINEQLKPDLDIVEEKAQFALTTGDLTQALMSCYELDIWLAAHLTDLLDKMALVDDDETAFEQHIRDYMAIEYADFLLSTPEYWNVACSYLATAGDVGIGRMRNILLHVATQTPHTNPSSKPKEQNDDMAVDGQTTSEVLADDDTASTSEFDRVESVLRACEEYQLEGVTKEICRIMSQRMLNESRYGAAVSFSVRADDRRQLRVIADAILDVYITDGQEAYGQALSTVPVALLSGPGQRALLGLPPAYEKDEGMSDTPSLVFPYESGEYGLTFATGLGFLLRFQHFLEAMANGEKARAAELLGALFASQDVPKSFLAVLLMDSVTLLEDEEVLLSANDTFELMRQLDEITTAASYAPEQYLRSLYRLTPTSTSSLALSKTTRATKENRLLPSRVQQEKNRIQEIEGMKLALKGLDAVRLAAVRNLSRVGMLGLPVL